MNDSYNTFAAGAYFRGSHSGSGFLSFNTGISQGLTTRASLVGGGSSAHIVNPEPGTFILVGTGFVALAVARRSGGRK